MIMYRLIVGLIAAIALSRASIATGQGVPRPDTVIVHSGRLALRGLLWRPHKAGPLPAILFNHGSYETRDSSIMLEAAVIGPVLAAHGYVVLVLFRQGVGLSVGLDSSGGDRLAQARLRGGQAAHNAMQLELLEGSEMDEAMAGLRLLRGRADVDPNRVALLGHSFGGSLALLMAARDTSIRAVVSFSGAAGSWEQAPELRVRLLAAVRQTSTPIFFNHAANDYSTASGVTLAAEMERLGRPHQLRIYPSFGHTPQEGHNMVFHDPSIWEADVVGFLSDHLGPAAAPERRQPNQRMKLSWRGGRLIGNGSIVMAAAAPRSLCAIR
jgi:dienelactone hydrolase